MLVRSKYIKAYKISFFVYIMKKRLTSLVFGLVFLVTGCQTPTWRDKPLIEEKFIQEEATRRKQNTDKHYGLIVQEVRYELKHNMLKIPEEWYDKQKED